MTGNVRNRIQIQQAKIYLIYLRCSCKTNIQYNIGQRNDSVFVELIDTHCPLCALYNNIFCGIVIKYLL